MILPLSVHAGLFPSMHVKVIIRHSVVMKCCVLLLSEKIYASVCTQVKSIRKTEVKL